MFGSGTIAPEPSSLPPELLTRLKSRSQQLRMLPAVATEALEIANDPNCSIREFAAVAERDAKLAADVLAMANSALYSPAQPILNLSQAVVRIGFRQVKNLILSTSMSSLVKNLTLEEEWIQEALCLHGFTTAMLCVNLNRSLNLGFQGEEFAAGLIHDFGRTLLAVSIPDQFTLADPLDFCESPDTLEHERSVLQTDHAAVGVFYAARNSLPEALSGVVEYHHQPGQAPRHRPLISLVATADHMANHLQRTGESAGYNLSENTGLRVLDSEYRRPLAEHIEEVLSETMNRSAAEAKELMSF